MKMFITGGTGFIGSHFLRQSLAAGHQVTALRRSPASRTRIPLAQEPVWLNRGMPEVGTEELASHEVLVHLAAAGVSEQHVDWATMFRVNVTESLALWLRAADAGVKHFLICGSCFEYGKSGERYEFIPPDALLEPTSAYAASKAAATMAAIAMAHERGLLMIVARPFQTFGEGEAGTRFWPALRQAALSGCDFEMTAGEQVRDFIAVEEVAAALLRLCAIRGRKAGETVSVNIGTGRPRTLRHFAESWWKEWGATGKLLNGALPYRRGEVMRYVPRLTAEQTLSE